MIFAVFNVRFSIVTFQSVQLSLLSKQKHKRITIDITHQISIDEIASRLYCSNLRDRSYLDDGMQGYLNVRYLFSR